MKKTYNINLGGIVFHIDEDAYDLLDKYLSNLRIHFNKEEGAEEIVHDMELRISELFSERLGEKKQVITLTDVEEIIAQMGKPEEFAHGPGGGFSRRGKGLDIFALFEEVGADGVGRDEVGVADGEGICRIGGGGLGKAEQGAHHESHLVFTGRASAHGG